MALQMYIRYLRKFRYHRFKKIPDFDVLAVDPEQTANILKNRLKDAGIKKVSIRKKAGVGEVIAPHYEVMVNKETVVMIYEPIACHSYNVIRMKGRNVKIATIDTMLNSWISLSDLKFLHAILKYYK